MILVKKRISLIRVMKKHLKLLVVALAIGLFAACSNNKETQTQEKIIPIKVMEIATTTTVSEQNYIGTVEESVAVSLSFSGNGTVEQVLVSEGQKVTQGQLLATLNTETATSAYNAAVAKLAQAQDAYDRLKLVHDNGSLPDIKFAEVEAGLQQAQSMVAITKKSLDDCKLYASCNGVIASRNIETGTNVLPGMSVFKIVSIDKVFVKFSVSENEIGSIKEGYKANVTVAALDNDKFSGKIEYKGIVANPVTHSYDVKTGIENPQKKLLPGMVCKVTVENTQIPQTQIIVPNQSIKIAANGNRYVWLADGNVAKRQRIETGEFNENGIVVVEGLSAGDKVITEGFQKISEGMKISITK
jgi:RND family efflux transporter MFP subunit